MKINELFEDSGAGVTGSSAIPSVPMSGGPNLLGGPNAKVASPFKRKSKKKTETIIKRVQQ